VTVNRKIDQMVAVIDAQLYQKNPDGADNYTLRRLRREQLKEVRTFLLSFKQCQD
jgi:hypothetical protein